MPYFLTEDGMAEHLDSISDRAEIQARDAAGARWFGTLAGAVIHGGVAATAFDKPVRVEPLYDGAEALAQGSVAGLTPVGLAAHYRVVAMEGALLHPPRTPSDLPGAAGS